jgi:hypothetical protein
MATAVMYVSLRGAKVAASAAPAAELQSYQSVARIYFGKKAAEAIDNLLRVQDEVKAATDYLAQFEETEAEGEDELPKYHEPADYWLHGCDEGLLRFLETVGIHTVENYGDKKPYQDEIDRMIVSALKDLEDVLRAELTYGEAAVEGQ